MELELAMNERWLFVAVPWVLGRMSEVAGWLLWQAAGPAGDVMSRGCGQGGQGPSGGLVPQRCAPGWHCV